MVEVARQADAHPGDAGGEHVVVARHGGALQHHAFHDAAFLAGPWLVGRAGKGQGKELLLEHRAHGGVVGNDDATDVHVDDFFHVALGHVALGQHWRGAQQQAQGRGGRAGIQQGASAHCIPFGGALSVAWHCAVSSRMGGGLGSTGRR
ncbi:hypothetical protein D3C72_1588190 [compost metagenome]